jgi:predicted metal-binding membrane protein
VPVKHAQPYRTLTWERNLILGLLLILAVGAWGILIQQQQSTMSDARGMSPTMGMGALLFIAVWVVMMVAMMFPTAAPMILIFARVHADRQQQGKPFVPTGVFVGAYLLTWTLFGVLAYFAALGAEKLAGRSAWVIDNVALLGGVVLIAAGLYQLSPLKHVCLSKCRSPMQFVLHHWRWGYGGAFRMGIEHGAYCLGCCWLMFVILFPLGIMNLVAMALVTALIFAEKSLSLGRRISWIAAGILIIYGALVIFIPEALPGMPSPSVPPSGAPPMDM